MNKKAFLLYFLVILALVFAVIYKQKIVRQKNQKKTVSFYSNWKEEGKLICTHTAKKADMQTAVKLTLIADADNTFLSFVPKATVRQLVIKSPVLIQTDEGSFSGEITSIGDNVDRETGMYPVKIFCSEQKGRSHQRYKAEIPLCACKDVVIIPHEAIDMEKDKYFVWIVKEGKAHKQFVTLKDRSDKGVLVSEGILEGDLVVIKGKSALFENDLVKIFNGR